MTQSTFHNKEDVLYVQYSTWFVIFARQKATRKQATMLEPGTFHN